MNCYEATTDSTLCMRACRVINQNRDWYERELRESIRCDEGAGRRPWIEQGGEQPADRGGYIEVRGEWVRIDGGACRLAVGVA